MNDLIDLLKRAAGVLEGSCCVSTGERYDLVEELIITAQRLERVFDKEPEAEPVA